MRMGMEPYVGSKLIVREGTGMVEVIDDPNFSALPNSWSGLGTREYDHFLGNMAPGADWV